MPILADCNMELHVIRLANENEIKEIKLILGIFRMGRFIGWITPISITKKYK